MIASGKPTAGDWHVKLSPRSIEVSYHMLKQAKKPFLGSFWGFFLLLTDGSDIKSHVGSK